MKPFKIKESYLLLLIVLGLVSLGVYTTYALFTASTTINDVVGITATLDIGKSLTEYEVITVPAGETKLIEFNVVNSYNGNIYYGAWYQIVKGNIDDIQIGLYTEKNSNPGSGSLSASTSINLLVGITNDNSTSVTLYIGVKGSLTNELNLGSNKTLIPANFSEALLVTEEVLEAHKETKTDTIEVENEVNKVFSATGAVQNVTLNKGTYKLQVWGAEGGYGYTSASSYPGGKGGYSYGTLTLNETTNLYVYVGGKGNSGTASSSIKTGGFNGGGNSGYSRGGSGGGATDIRIGQDSLYSRVIVAGGGGGGAYYVGYYGGAGGGTSALDGTGYSTTYKSKGGTQTSGGSAGYYGSYKGTTGSFGQGGAASTTSSSYNRSGGGGGGWYGGGGGAYNSSSTTYYYGVSGGGGGSGYVYTSSTASNYPSGCLLNSNYYLTDAATIAGNTSFESTTGGTETGHSNAGYAKITGIEIVTTTGTVTYYTIPNLTGLTDLIIQLGSNKNLTDGTKLICANNSTTGCSLESVSVTDTSSLQLGEHEITYVVKDSKKKRYKFLRKINVVNYVTSEVLEANKKTITEDLNLEYTTAEKTLVNLNPGTYKLEVWGAEGGNAVGGNTQLSGGKGGYSYGTLTLSSAVNLYVYVGGAGNSKVSTNVRENETISGGFNGGGSLSSTGSSAGGSGGGASDIRIGQDSLYARVIVAGGGGGGGASKSTSVSTSTVGGGYGGGSSGGSGSGKSTSSNYGGSTVSATVAGGSISSGGSSGRSTVAGSFGTGGSTSSGTSSGVGTNTSGTLSGAGGGGWYGGSSGNAGSEYTSGGGGGSGWVYTSSNFDSWKTGNATDAANWLLNSTYYLTDAETISGGTSFTDFSGSTVTGHSGTGAVRISGTTTAVAYTIPNLTGLTNLTLSQGTSTDLITGTTLTCANNTTTGCSITNILPSDTSTLNVGSHTITYTVIDSNNNKYYFARNITITS